MPEFPLLLEPYVFSSVELKNRIVMPPLFTGYAQGDGSVSPLILNHYHELAKGGVAMIVVENTIVDLSGTLSGHCLRADDDRFLPGLSALAEGIKKEGAAAVIQINHGGRFARSKTLLAPSAVPISEIQMGGFYKAALKSMDIQRQLAAVSEAIQQRPQRPKEMTLSDILQIQAAYGAAAVRAKKAGFDMVEIHGGTGYLPVQFLSGRTNRRMDRYGGSLENRMRFPLELTEGVMDAVRPDFPVGYRFLADEWLPGGFSLEEAKEFARRLSDIGIAYLSVTGGTYESFSDPQIIEKSREPGYMVYLAREIKAVVRCPVIAGGRITTPDLAEEILREEKADLIGLARPLFADPQWVQKARTGKKSAIRLCENCGNCLQMVITERPVLCSQWDTTKRIQRRRMMKEMQNPRKKVLLAMDGSENAAMGAAYAGEMLAGRKDVAITLFHIQTDESDETEKDIRAMLEVSRTFLKEAGIPDAVITILIRKKKVGIAQDILEEIASGGYGTLVVGRRGLSRTQQILFGSVSNKIVQNAKDCTVWVVD